jgi:hypothetical protein
MVTIPNVSAKVEIHKHGLFLDAQVPFGMEYLSKKLFSKIIVFEFFALIPKLIATVFECKRITSTKTSEAPGCFAR